jgi:hypothetical protein
MLTLEDGNSVQIVQFDGGRWMGMGHLCKLDAKTRTKFEFRGPKYFQQQPREIDFFVNALEDVVRNTTLPRIP